MCFDITSRLGNKNPTYSTFFKPSFTYMLRQKLFKLFLYYVHELSVSPCCYSVNIIMSIISVYTFLYRSLSPSVHVQFFYFIWYYTVFPKIPCIIIMYSLYNCSNCKPRKKIFKKYPYLRIPNILYKSFRSHDITLKL